MRRAVILIGVSTTGGLPKLRAVESGIAQMQAWAAAQHIEGDQLVVLTDKSGKVRAYQIVDAIEELVRRRNLDQLIIYFTGHGIHNRGDFWLLSDAPVKAAEAVNVEGSIQLARYCGVDHVVFMSDACRTAADGIQALGITGTEIFPNDPVDGMDRTVDAFFACARGKPALEVRDPVQAAGSFSALYTEVLSECLAGMHAAVLDQVQQDGAEVCLVRPWKLADELLAEVPSRLKAKLGRTPSVNQTPVARICSRDAWISRVPASQLARTRGGPVSVLSARQGRQSNVFDAADQMLSAALSGRSERIDDLLGDVRGVATSGDSLLRSAAGDLASAFGPSPHEIGCGFRLHGAAVRAVHSVGAKCTVFGGTKGTLVSIDLQGKPSGVLLELEDGGGVVMPAIPDFVAELTFDVGELAHVAYEPSEVGARWTEYESRQSEVRALRGSIAAAAGMGVFRLTDANEAQIARAMKVAKSLDPSTALYTAYAYHEMGQRTRIIQDMQMRLQLDLGFTFFDIALLAGSHSLQSAQRSDTVLPAVPMLSQGWSLLKAFRVQVAPEWVDLQSYLRPSLWTLFNSAGTRRLVDALQLGRIRV